MIYFCIMVWIIGWMFSIGRHHQHLKMIKDVGMKLEVNNWFTSAVVMFFTWPYFVGYGN